MNESTRRTVIVYRNELLPPSETFIKDQGEGLSNFTAFYVGLRLKQGGLALPAERTFVLSHGGLAEWISEAILKLTGWAPRLDAAIRAELPCLIHAHFGPDAGTILPAARRLRLPLVVTFHGFDVNMSDDCLRMTRPGRRYFRRRELLKTEATLLLANSEFTRQRLLEKGFPEHKVRLHYIGVDTEVFCPNPGLVRRPVVLFVGRLVANKGCGFLIRAMAEVQRVRADVELVIIGDGPQRSDLEQAAAGSLSRFKFLGTQPRSVVLDWMRSARVFCVPSVTIESGESEGFGQVFAEAQATGLPVASFATGGIPEAVTHGETGLLAPERDWQALAANILTLVIDLAAWESMSRAGEEQVRHAFDLRKQCVKLEQIYAEAIALNKQVHKP